ncbi:Precorrin-6A reductase [Petrocella atlantisensis]|uniref:Precorrin-6A reductase n=1 Tax=Petrocella atlantisensis TaxID=2173034 RepID=A0A3P7PNH5_9FIRM|nr:precorrin-6A reductase [Petrocella atlantisensis]VDN46067.1 Precorrin-6A reductase [Petrocella atlantisensis]
MIYVIGGTHECRQICEILKHHHLPFILSVATKLGEDTYGHYADRLIVKRLDAVSMDALIRAEKINWVIDASHPHAVLVSQQAIEAAKATGTTYTRFVRKTQEDAASYGKFFENEEEALNYLSGQQGQIMVTGSKTLEEAIKVLGLERIVARVVPSTESLHQCEHLGLKPNQIIALLGPFSVEMNRLLLKTYHISYLMFKEGGEGSGYIEKLKACQLEKVKAIVVKVPYINYREVTESYEALLEKIKDYYNRHVAHDNSSCK